MSFAMYVIGDAVLICGLIYAESLIHIHRHWMIATAIVMAGIGILSAVKATRQKDPVR